MITPTTPGDIEEAKGGERKGDGEANEIEINDTWAKGQIKGAKVWMKSRKTPEEMGEGAISAGGFIETGKGEALEGGGLVWVEREGT